MSPDVNIRITTTDATTQANKKIVGSFTELSSALGLARQGLEVVKKAYSETIGVTINYANQVRQLSSLSGQSTEATSRFIQVLDDYKIGAEDALLATKALTKNGHAPSIETLAKLSDEYLALNSVEEQNAFILKNLGKGGLQWVEVLQKGSKALTEQGKAVNANLLLSEKAVKQARVYELALDDWNDAILAAKVSLGTQLLPAMIDILNTSNDLKRAQELAAKAGTNWTWASMQQRDAFVELAQAERNAASATDTLAIAQEKATETAAELEEAQKAISDAHENFKGTLESVAPAWDTYRDGVAEARNELAAGTITTEEYSAKVRELGGAFEETKNTVILSMVAMKLKGDEWTDASFAAYLKVAKGLGVITGAQETAANSWIKTADDLVSGAMDVGTAFEHIEGRGLDAVGSMEEFYMAQGMLGAGIRRDALPATAALARAMGQLPESRSWVYDFYVNVIRSGGSLNFLSQFGNTATTNASIDAIREGSGGGRASGGPLYGGITVVGDSPGGGMTPYTEAIYNGMVFDARTTRKMHEAGMLDGAMGMAVGGDLFGTGAFSGAGSGGTSRLTTTRRRRTSGSRAPVSGLGGGGISVSSLGGSAAESVAVTAAETAQEATSVAASSLATVESVASSVQQSSQQQVSATFSSSDSIVAEQQRTNVLLQKLLSETRGQKYQQALSV